MRCAAGDIKPGRAFPVMTMIAAGASPDVSVPAGECVAIATGAAVPAGLDAVIPHEQSDRGNPVHFTIDTIEQGSAIHPRGADAKAGDVLIHKRCASGGAARRHCGVRGCAQVKCVAGREPSC